MTRRLLVVDDAPEITALVGQWLRGVADVVTASDPDEGLAVLLREVPDLALVDVVMPSGGGRRFMEEARRYLPGCAVIGMSGSATPQEFVELFRLGMCDFLTKPFTREEISRAMTRALRVRGMREAIARLDESACPESNGDPLDALVGRSAPWLAAVKSLRAAATVDASVLLVGEPGTGKDLASRCLHAASARRDGPFVVVSCATLPQSLLEAELFGHAAGAFTGARGARPGRFAEAEGGTLVLADIGSVPVASQALLLRALESGFIQRVGENDERRVNVRIIATTATDPFADVRQGRMREDLLHRMNRLRIDLPPLRERGDDLLLLASRLLERQAAAEQRRPLPLTRAAIAALREHDWPGNVRELSNVLQRAAIRAREAGMAPGRAALAIDAAHLSLGRAGGVRLDPADWPLPEGGLDLPGILAAVEADLVSQALSRAGGHHAKAAALLRIGRSTLERKLGRTDSTRPDAP